MEALLCGNFGEYKNFFLVYKKLFCVAKFEVIKKYKIRVFMQFRCKYRSLVVITKLERLMILFTNTHKQQLKTDNSIKVLINLINIFYEMSSLKNACIFAKLFLIIRYCMKKKHGIVLILETSVFCCPRSPPPWGGRDQQGRNLYSFLLHFLCFHCSIIRAMR